VIDKTPYTITIGKNGYTKVITTDPSNTGIDTLYTGGMADVYVYENNQHKMYKIIMKKRFAE
jgi:hypothetical protein